MRRPEPGASPPVGGVFAPGEREAKGSPLVKLPTVQQKSPF
jgi:hypothetical protein